MQIIEYIMLLLLVSIGVISSITDIAKGVIRNRTVLVFALIAFVLDGIYYSLFAREMLLYFLINMGVIIIICLCLYFTHSLAGGDCKLIPVMCLLYPAGAYLIYKNSVITMFLPLCFAIVLGYLYLLASSIIHIFTGETKIDGKTVGKSLLSYLKSYITAFIYITLVGIILSLFGKYFFELPTVLYFVICIVVAWLSGKVRVFKNTYVLIAVAVADVVLSIVFRIIPVSLSVGTYIFTAILVLCQLTIRTNLYDVIKTENVKKGMILSTFSSLLMQDSGIENLPGISTENLSSRLSEEEAESVRRWGESKRGKKEIAVVKKIPFAVFIFAGFVLYFVIWSIIR